MAASQPPSNLRRIQRFVTTHDVNGKTTFSSEVPEPAPFKTLPDGVQFALCYATKGFPVSLAQDDDVKTYKQYTENLPGIMIPSGTVLRVVDMPPGDTSPMHRTISLDYGVVLEGEIDLILDSGEQRHLERGDMAVQRGTNHAWRNSSATSWARMLYVLQPAESLQISGRTLADNSAETIPGVEAPH